MSADGGSPYCWLGPGLKAVLWTLRWRRAWELRVRPGKVWGTESEWGKVSVRIPPPSHEEASAQRPAQALCPRPQIKGAGKAAYWHPSVWSGLSRRLGCAASSRKPVRFFCGQARKITYRIWTRIQTFHMVLNLRKHNHMSDWGGMHHIWPHDYLHWAWLNVCQWCYFKNILTIHFNWLSFLMVIGQHTTYWKLPLFSNLFF